MRIQPLLDRRKDFPVIARMAETTEEYLIQVAYGHRKASHSLAKRIDRVTKGGVSKGELRPDIFGP